MDKTYEIVPGQSADGTNWFAVVEYVDGQATGADHHWLLETSARSAKAAYERGAVQHPGKISDFVLIPSRFRSLSHSRR